MTRVIKTLVLLLVIGGSLAVAWHIDFEQALNSSDLVELLQSLGPWGPVILIVSMATAVIIPPIPSLPLDLASGAAFGPLLGTTYAVMGAAIKAIVSSPQFPSCPEPRETLPSGSQNTSCSRCMAVR
jgi:uncharacterized membrane protein YdjX (TVP38/TMEM64 family)